MKPLTDGQKWLVQAILWDELQSSFLKKIDDLDFIDSLAWSYTQRNQRFIPHKDIMAACEKIKDELRILGDKYLL